MLNSSGRTLRRAVAMQLRGRMLAGVPLAPLLLASPAVLAQQDAALEEIVVTAQKRTESLQEVPISIQALGTERLEQLQINSFEDYVKFLPSVTFTTLGPGFSLAYFRGVASGENNNHSGPSPSVGMYLDEQPITTIQGALDIHLYDIERVESLAGPQGTLYGANSQAGTIRIITNKPDPSGFEGAYSLEGTMIEHGDPGYLAEGFVNIPLHEKAAIRLVGWVGHDGGYIDNVVAERTFPTSGGCISNAKTPPPGCQSTPVKAKDDYNDVDTYGGRAALKVDLTDNWSIMPQVMGQQQEAHGSFAYDPAIDELKIARWYKEYSKDRWIQAALTIEGRVANFDIVYAGAYLDRDDWVDADYSDYSYFYDQCCGYGSYWGDDTGTPLADPSQFITGSDKYKRTTHELRIASPTDKRFRVVGGVFYQDSQHKIFQNYQIPGLGGYLSEGVYYPIEVTGWPDTIWLTNQIRKDTETAVFGEASFDILDSLTATVGLRWFQTENSLRGFFGFNANYSENYGEFLCFSDKQYNGSPCTNLDDSVDDSDTVPKFNLTWRFTDDKLVYATYSEGYRPGGINRNGTVAPYKPDFLKNYEMGWKTMWGGNRLRWNGAIFREEWKDIQYSFLPPSGSGLTVIQNAGSARVDGIEMDMTWAATDSLIISGGLSWLDSQLTKDYVPDPDSPPAAFKGDSLPIAPDLKANVTGRYTFQVGEYASFAQIAYVYNGSSWSDLPREERSYYGKQPAWSVTDISLGATRDAFTLTFFINNLFDDLSRNWTWSQCTVSVCGINPYYTPNQPRTYGLRFSQEF